MKLTLQKETVARLRLRTSLRTGALQGSVKDQAGGGGAGSDSSDPVSHTCQGCSQPTDDCSFNGKRC